MKTSLALLCLSALSCANASDDPIARLRQVRALRCRCDARSGFYIVDAIGRECHRDRGTLTIDPFRSVADVGFREGRLQWLW
jgi:hypothetical protein